MDVKERVAAILQKTYAEHALGAHAWGLSTRTGACSYELGCAIGLSLSLDLRKRVPEIGLPELMQTCQEVCHELLGLSWKDVPTWAVRCLEQVQRAHDDCALRDARTEYAGRLLDIAAINSLELKGPREEG